MVTSFEEYLKTTVPVGPGCVAPADTAMFMDYRVAVQEITEQGVHVIIHPMNRSGTTLDLMIKDNDVSIMHNPNDTGI